MSKILIVDDSAFMRTILKDILSNHEPPFEIFEADGKATALAQFKKVTPDLMLLDVVMGNNEMEGVEILREIKEFFPATKMVMITSVGQTAVVEECKRLGALSYIEKPFDRDLVIETVDKYLS